MCVEVRLKVVVEAQETEVRFEERFLSPGAVFDLPPLNTWATTSGFC